MVTVVMVVMPMGMEMEAMEEMQGKVVMVMEEMGVMEGQKVEMGGMEEMAVGMEMAVMVVTQVQEDTEVKVVKGEQMEAMTVITVVMDRI
ncbi:hypothetical protein QMQ27_004768 [Salmonella enterica]|nr:hypothetical protein [Salmonella enterica]EKB8061791.1 hypothetical protein [Salmonella enterica]ELW0416535.1 hypothetical protein [Salmonella enterica]ELW0426345.1 hypothetical protein [Salmonella enterica]